MSLSHARARDRVKAGSRLAGHGQPGCLTGLAPDSVTAASRSGSAHVGVSGAELTVFPREGLAGPQIRQASPAA